MTIGNNRFSCAINLITLTYLVLISSLVIAEAQIKFSLDPTTPTGIHIPGYGNAIIEYQVTNNTKIGRTLTVIPWTGVTQNTAAGKCPSPFYLASNSSCLLSLNVDRALFIPSNSDPTFPKLCKTQVNNPTPDPFLCSQVSQQNAIQIKTLNIGGTLGPDFPYGSAPQGNVCVSSPYYATPETMLGSWAMIQAVENDSASGVLPNFLNTNNVVYAVGTAALGDQLGIPNCSGGCNQLNGYCFAIKFNNKPSYPYMIFQSVNIAANANSFDIYMAGGGSGAFPDQCKQFWGTDNSVNWGANIENSPPPACETYFNNFTTINSEYTVTYNNVTHPAKQTLMDACQFASAGQTAFNTQNWSNLSVVPVTCPQSLNQITGVEIPSDITTVGNQKIYNLTSLTEQNFTQSTITTATTTQMQDCNTPSSGYCGNVSQSVPNYQASISANLTNPLLTSPPPTNNYCQQNPSVTGFCSWDKGQSSGSNYCNQSDPICISCGNSAQWCTCSDGQLISCSSS